MELDFDAHVMANETQMQQLLMNICTNAAHAMGERGGVLQVGFDEVDLDVEAAERLANVAAGPFVCLSVKDTGTGIHPSIIERIFDPFFTTKAVGEGTGMGLALVHGIVDNHCGTISVKSEPGMGTTFEVFLPRAADGRARYHRGAAGP